MSTLLSVEGFEMVHTGWTRREAEFAVAREGQGTILDGAGLAVSNPLDNRPLAVPRVVILGDTAEGEPAVWWKVPWSRDGERSMLEPDWASSGTGEQAFWRFLQLADENRPERFVDFARRFGVLGLWQYRTADGKKVFALTDEYWVPSIPDGIQTPYRFTTWTGSESKKTRAMAEWLYEPIAEWRRWARWTGAVVRIAFTLRDGRCASRSQWLALEQEHWFDDPRLAARAPRFATDLGRQRQHLAILLRRLFLRWSGLVPTLQWDGDRPHVTIALGGDDAVLMRRASMQDDWPENALFPALVAWLLAFISAGQHVAACSRCGQLTPSDRAPRKDQPHYGDHDECRLAARRETKRNSAASARRSS